MAARTPARSEGLARDETRRRGAQECAGSAELGGGAEAARRVLRSALGQQFGQRPSARLCCARHGGSQAVGVEGAGLARKTVARNVTINNLLPGNLDTDRMRPQGVTHETPEEAAERRRRQSEKIPAKRLGTPEEFGQICAFLSSVHAGYLTGQNIPVDGGLYVSAF